MTASDVMMYSPRFVTVNAGGGHGQVPAAAAAACLLAAANAERHQQQQQPAASGYSSFGSAAAGGPGSDNPFNISPTQLNAMQEATRQAELAAATAAAMSVDTLTAAAAAAAAAANIQTTSAAELFYREARLYSPAYVKKQSRLLSQQLAQQEQQQQQQQQQQCIYQQQLFGNGSGSFPSTPAGNITPRPSATAAAADVAMHAAAAASESAVTTAPHHVMDISEQPVAMTSQGVFTPGQQLQQHNLAHHNLAHGDLLGPGPGQFFPANFARLYSNTAASSFSMPSEGTATAAAALAGLATAGQYYGQHMGSVDLQQSPAQSQQEQQQVLMSKVHEMIQAGDPEAAAAAAAAAAAVAADLPDRSAQAAHADSIAGQAAAAEGGLPLTFQWAGTGGPVGQTGAGCSSSKPPLPPAAQAAAAAVLQGGGGSPPQGEGVGGGGVAGGGCSDRVLSPAGSGTSRLPAVGCLPEAES
jgi:hypothetical protein